MKKIKGVTKKLRNYARNGEHVDYHTNVTGTITPEIAEKYKISKQYSTYTGWFAQEKLIYKPNTEFEQTEEIEAKDRVRDEIAVFLKEQIDSFLRYPVETKKAAAKLLEHASKPYVDAYNKSYAENTAEVNAWIAALKSDAYASAVTELGLDEAVAKLEEANTDFNETMKERSREKRLRDEKETMKTIRPKVDDAYVALVNAINALYLANEIATQDEETREELGALIDEINSLIIQLEDVLERRGASSGTDDEEEEEETEEEEPTPEPVTPEITKFYPKENANPDKPLEFPRNKTAVLEGKGLKLVDSPEGKKAQLVLINYVDQRMPHEDSAILLNTDEKIEFTMMYDAAEGQYNFQIETYPNGTEEAVIIKYPETITLV